ncbi:MAG: glucosamine-6-phosphate deaminase [bacterium]|nr:glucosamine-6-phosphate deaminase [bacterium]MDD5756538.1 glucosamine-6-phosphate deaminase [bacterium]
MDIIIKTNYQEMSLAAASIIADLIRSKPDCVLGLATGSTPLGMYRELIRMHKEEGLDFSQVKTFNLDEYLGIGMDLAKSYDQDRSSARFMQEEFFKHINLQKVNIHLPDGLAKDINKFCAWYEEEIVRAGGIDLQVLGIGANGHWAFNEPGSSLSSRTRVQQLAQQTIDDNYESFYKKAGVSKETMPHFAVTLGIGTILESKHALMLANGEKKTTIVAKALQGPVTSEITASAIQMHKGKVTVVLDLAAAAQLK